MNFDQIMPAIAMILILILVLPGFLSSNSNLRIFLKNISIWTVIVLVVMIVLYFFD
tara:strand:- start:257 stop:424 length:168 start_codon:yes stop_codon:yes gene_type:complete